MATKPKKMSAETIAAYEAAQKKLRAEFLAQLPEHLYRVQQYIAENATKLAEACVSFNMFIDEDFYPGATLKFSIPDGLRRNYQLTSTADATVFQDALDDLMEIVRTFNEREARREHARGLVQAMSAQDRAVLAEFGTELLRY